MEKYKSKFKNKKNIHHREHRGIIVLQKKKNTENTKKKTITKD
jgi:hypothetical protein